MKPSETDEQWLRPTKVIGLMAGRATFRLASYGAGILLLAHWGSTTFALYASAIGAMAWLITVTAGGMEKAAQTFLPRDPNQRLERFFVVAACTPYAVAVLGWLVVLVSSPHSTLSRYLAAAVLPCGVGACSVLIALFRMRGRATVDAATYLHLSGGYAAGVLAVVVLDLQVTGFFIVLLGWQSSAIVVLLNRVRRLELGSGASRDECWSAVRAIPLLSSTELAGPFGVSMLYVLLALAADPQATSTFYVMAVAAGVVGMAWTYFLRLIQPRLVRRIVSGVVLVLRQGRRMTTYTTLVGTSLSGALAVGLWINDDVGRPLLAALVVTECLLFIGSTAGGFVLENLNPRGRTRSAVTAVVYLVVVVAAGAGLVPWRGAAGAFFATCLALLARATLLHIFLVRHRVATTPPAVTQTNDGSRS